MMIEQVISVITLLQRYFFSLCHYISFNVKRLDLLRSPNPNRKRIAEGVGSAHVGDRRQGLSKIKLKPCSEIPGPKCLPVVGSLFEFNKFGPRRVHELAVERHDKHGDIFRERIFSQEMVFVASTPLQKEWMSQEGKFPMSFKQEPSLLFSEVFPYLKRGLFFRNGEEWFNLRKLGHCIMHKNAADFDVEGLYENCEHFFHDYLNGMRQSICGGGQSGVIVDLEDRAYNIVLGATIRIVYGQFSESFTEYTGTDITTLSRNAREVNICCQKLLEMPARVAKWFGLAVWKEYSTKLHYNLTSCMTYGQRRREEIKKSPEKASMRTHGLLYKSMEMKAPLQDVDDMLCDFAIDSKDPLAATCMFVTQLLANCPEIQEKILEEVNKVFPSNQRITYGKCNYLEYTNGFFKEVLRLYPIAAFSARIASEDTEIGGYHVPPGTMIMFSSYVSQRDPRYFSDPLKVLPERWLADSSKSSNNGVTNRGTPCRPTSDPAAFTVFGLNQRVCLGQKMTTSIFILYIANLVRLFKLKTDKMPESEMRTVLYPTDPNNPIHLRVR